MKLLKIKFKAVDSGYEEVMHKYMAHGELVKFLALGKARAAAKKYPKAVIIAADTIVSFRGKAIGKPKNRKEAFLMLKEFSGKTHSVFSGVAVLDARSKKVFSWHDTVKVTFKKLSAKEINNYLSFGQAMDKAGAYGPLGKGINLIEKIQGDITTDLGMPLGFVFNSLRKLGVKV